MIDPRMRAAIARLDALEVDDPGVVRREAVRTLREAAASDFVVFHDLVVVDGRFTVSEVITEGRCDGPGLAKTLRTFHDRPLKVFEFRRPPEQLLSGFTSPRQLFPSREAFEASELYNGAWKPHGAHDISGLVVYHGPDLVGAISASYFPPRLLLPEEHARLLPLVRPLRSLLTAAHCLARKGLPDETAYLLVRPDGRFEHASEAARAWTRRRAFADAIRTRVRVLDRRGEPRDSSALEQAEARIVRLRTDGGTRYLVCLRPAPLVRRGGAPLLTKLQLRVALAAADGATISEIARDTSRSEETVRDHLAAAYRKLGVATRLELVRALRAQDLSTEDAV